MRYWITHGTSAVLRSPVIMVSVSVRSEEHTSELQSQSNLVCRLLLEKKKDGTNDGGGMRFDASPEALNWEGAPLHPPAMLWPRALAGILATQAVRGKVCNMPNSTRTI